MNTYEQMIEIERYFRHLQRIGQGTSLEAAAVQWISRYAALWRLHQETRRAA